MSGNEKNGYHLVCPDFGPGGRKLSNDAQARCLSCLLGRINEVATVPPGVRFEIIVLRWHHFGAAYPSIGIPAETIAGTGQDMTLLSLKLGDQISDFIQTLGVDSLVELSAGETITWADVVKSEEP